MEHCLNELISPVSIENYNCESCNSKIRSKTSPQTNQKTIRSNSVIKQNTRIGKIPQCLCIHFERSVHGFEYGESTTYKVPCYVNFPETLDISKYCISDPENGFFGSNKMFKRKPAQSDSSNSCYSLRAVVVHLGGSAEEGHFIAYKKIPQNLLCLKEEDYPKKLSHLIESTYSFKNNVNDEWVKVSDSNFAPVNKEQVFSQTAYMLFYERLYDKNLLNLAN